MQIPSISGSDFFPTTPINPTQGAQQSASITDPAAKSFDQVLGSLTASDQNANSMIESLASGGNADLANVMMASSENDVNFRVSLAIRDQLVNAYREVMRMAI